MRSKILLLSFLFSTTGLFAQQNENPYAYNNVIITDDQPSSVKEYGYDYTTQVAALVKNHTFKYNSNGLLTEHIESNKGIADWYQTFRYRFQYDSKSRLIYFWNEQQIGSAYESQREQQWVYDAQGMITENNNWAVTNGTKYLDIHSFKRVITRDANNQVLKIEESVFTSYPEDGLVLDKIYTYKYDENNILDSIIVFARNITLGGIMKLYSKQYDFDFKNYDVLNTDLLVYNSYQTSNYNDDKTNVSNTFDIEGRMLTQTVKYLDDELINKTEWTYETDKITKADLYEKEINYIDASGRTWKHETYTKNGTDWELESPSYDLHIRTFENDRITSDLYKNYYDSQTQTYKNDARYEYSYSLTTGIFNQQNADVVLLYPNPSTGVVNVNDFQKIEKLSISCVTGVTMTVALQEQIDLSALPAGVYIVSATYKDQSSSIQRLVLK